MAEDALFVAVLTGGEDAFSCGSKELVPSHLVQTVGDGGERFVEIVERPGHSIDRKVAGEHAAARPKHLDGVLELPSAPVSQLERIQLKGNCLGVLGGRWMGERQGLRAGDSVSCALRARVNGKSRH